jgi:dTDP-4-amino-4,6-dideoxygalactose transaminase
MSLIKFCDIQKINNKYSGEITEKVIQVMASGSYIEGEEVSVFEQSFAKYIGMEYCIGVGNGTDALEIAIKSLNLPTGSEIIVPGNTYVATCMAVVNNNHKLVLCDIDDNMMMTDIESIITEKTKAIIAVHMYGKPQNMALICELANKHGVYVIEDCAQAHGATINTMRVGSFGHISCFSFYPTKNLGACGDGGCIITNSVDIYNYITKYKNFGSVSKNNHDMIGRNSRLDTVQAGILNIKLKYLDDDNNLRKRNAKLYYDLLSSHNMLMPITIPFEYSDNNVYHLFTICVSNRDELIKYLKDNSIETAIHYPTAICDMNIFDVNHTPNCSRLSKQTISLPMYPELTEREISTVCDKIRTFYDSQLKSVITPNKSGVLHYRDIDFPTKRLFYIDNIDMVPCNRGNHAILNFNELVIIISGSIVLKLRDKHGNIICDKVLKKNDTFRISCNIWINYTITELNTVILVLCDKTYSESHVENDKTKFFVINQADV